MMQMIKNFAWLGVFLFFFNRSSFGNRNKEQRWPHWMEKLGDRDIPHIVSSDWFFEIAWLSRRVLPIVGAFTALALWSYITDGRSYGWLSGPEWLAILGLSIGFFAACVPFAKRPRRHPLDKWMGMVFGLAYSISGIVMAAVALVLHYAHVTLAPTSTLGHLTHWATSASLGDTLSIAAGIIGFGVTITALVEILPNWRTKAFVVDQSEEIEQLRSRNEELAAEVHRLRKKVRNHSRRRRR